MRCVCTSWYQANALLTRAVLLLAGARAAARVGAGHLQPALDPRHARPNPGEPLPAPRLCCASPAPPPAAPGLRDRDRHGLALPTLRWEGPPALRRAQQPVQPRQRLCAPLPSPPFRPAAERYLTHPRAWPRCSERMRCSGDGCARVCVTPPPRPSPRAAPPPPSLLLHSQPLTPSGRAGEIYHISPIFYPFLLVFCAFNAL